MVARYSTKVIAWNKGDVEQPTEIVAVMSLIKTFMQEPLIGKSRPDCTRLVNFVRGRTTLRTDW